MRRTLILTIVASWVVLLAVLVRKHAPPDLPDVATLPGVALEERDEWFGVYRNGEKVGHAHRVIVRLSGGYRFFEDSVMALAMLGVPQTLRTSLTAETDAGFALRRFRFTLISPATVFSASGAVEGLRLAVTYGPEGQRATLTVPLEEPIYLPSTLRARILGGELTAGTRYRVPVFSPLTLRNETMSVTVEGRERLTGSDGPRDTIVLSEEYQSMRTRVWLEAGGAVVREEAALGFTLARESRAQAVAGADTRIPVDLAVTSRIPLEGHIADPRGTDRLTLRVRGAARHRIPDDPPRQRVTADLVRIAREDLPRPGAAPGMVAGAVGEAASDTDVARVAPASHSATLAPYLAPGPFIESDDPAVRATARTVVGDARDTTTAAERLVAWVHANVEQAPTVTVPSAREVLASRRGDCNEHAVLLTALARAAGIPARIVAGAAYAGDAFYYHAWTELWLGRWVSADGVFGQLPVDATHVKLVEGGLERHVDLIGVIGALAFVVEEDRS